MTESEKQLILDYFIRGDNIGKMDVFDAVEFLTRIDGDTLISAILSNRDSLRPIETNDIPQFSDEHDIYNVLRVLIDSGLSELTYEQIGSYLCPVNAKATAMRKYGENHYKFAAQIGLAKKGYPLLPTEIGIAYYLFTKDSQRQELMDRLVYSIPFVQHILVKASEGPFLMMDYLDTFLAHSTALRRRSNLHKIMRWASEITQGESNQLFDNIVWY